MERRKRRSAGAVPHPESGRIARGIERCIPLTVAWSGDLFRATSHEYANQRDVMTGAGSRRAGARYNAKGMFPAVYAALDVETALGESLANSRRLGVPDAEQLPLTLVCLRVRDLRILDLTSGLLRQALGISKGKLLQRWRPHQHAGREALTQAIGRLSRSAGFQAIRYDSAHVPGGRNMVVFTDRLRRDQIELVNKNKLPVRRPRK